MLSSVGAAATVVAHVPASGGGNGGFTGLAPDPSEPRTFFVVYSVDDASAPHGKHNRLSRIVDGHEQVLFDRIPWAEFHVGGRVAIGPDGDVYVTTGDNGGPNGTDDTRHAGSYPNDPVQDPSSLVGKVLRFTKDGAPAGGVAGWDPAVYAMGFRNPFGLVFGPDGTLYLAENGIDHDEVNVVRQGANYGWPLCEGACAGHQSPLTTFPDSFGTTGIAYLGGKLYMGDYDGGRLRVIDPATGAASVSWSAGSGNVLDVAAGPDGCLYASTFDAIFQVDISNTGGCHLGSTPVTTTVVTTTTTPPPSKTTAPPATTSPPPTTTSPPHTATSPSPNTTSPPPSTTSLPPATTSAPPATSTSAPPVTTTATSTTTTTPGSNVTLGSTPQEAVGHPVNGSTQPLQTPAPGVGLLVAAGVAAAVLSRRRR